MVCWASLGNEQYGFGLRLLWLREGWDCRKEQASVVQLCIASLDFDTEHLQFGQKTIDDDQRPALTTVLNKDI